MAVIPFGVYMGLATTFGINDVSSSNLLVLLYVITICTSYLSGLGALSVVQSNSCGAVKNMKQIAGNAALSTFIIVMSLSLAVFIPGLKNIVVQLFPPTMDPLIAEAIGYSYFLFFGALYGVVTAGYLSANCGQ
jgi:hypothetical protein